MSLAAIKIKKEIILPSVLDWHTTRFPFWNLCRDALQYMFQCCLLVRGARYVFFFSFLLGWPRFLKTCIQQGCTAVLTEADCCGSDELFWSTFSLRKRIYMSWFATTDHKLNVLVSPSSSSLHCKHCRNVDLSWKSILCLDIVTVMRTLSSQLGLNKHMERAGTP